MRIVECLVISFFCCVHSAFSFDLKVNEARTFELKASDPLKIRPVITDSSVERIVLYVNSLQHRICISTTPDYCIPSTYGASVGFELAFKRVRNADLYIHCRRDMLAKVFVVLRAYKNAPILGACFKGNREKLFSPNLMIDSSNTAYNVLSFNYSGVTETLHTMPIVLCSDTSFWSSVSYQVYAMSWNQRYDEPSPSFTKSSLKSLFTALNHSSSPDLFNTGILLKSFTKESTLPPRIHISKRFGLDLIIAVAAHLNDGETSFYVSQIVLGCQSGNQECAYLISVWSKVFIGIFAVFCFLFAHLGRRFHKLSIFSSGYFLGFLVCYPLLSQLTHLNSYGILIATTVGCCLGFSGLLVLIFWRSKPTNKLSHLPLYLCASFLIVASLFFTSVGNMDFWEDEGAFFGTFFGIIAFLSVLVFPWITELIAVDLCSALVGTFFFIACSVAIFTPGCVFPYILLDAINRVSQPNNHAALSVFVSSTTDFIAFVAWPVLTLVVTLLNHYCTPPLDKSRLQRVGVQAPAAPRDDANWLPVDSWPPLPPAAFASERRSERRPLLDNSSSVERLQPLMEPTAPPPYHAPDEAPPAYRP